MATAIISVITQRPVRSDIGMTGEITLTGRVLPIGGLKEKALAAHRAGIKYIVAPASNKPDWSELPRTVRQDLEPIWVENMDDVVAAVLRESQAQPAVPVAKSADIGLSDTGQRRNAPLPFQQHGQFSPRRAHEACPPSHCAPKSTSHLHRNMSSISPEPGNIGSPHPRDNVV